MPWLSGATMVVSMDVGTNNFSCISALKVHKGWTYYHTLREIFLTESDTDRQCLELLRVLANEFPRSLLLVFTRHGTNAAGVAAHRPPRAPILAVTDSRQTLRHLKMVRAVEPFLLEAFMVFKDSLFKTRVHVRQNGIVSMSDEELKIEGMPVMQDVAA